MGQSRGPDGAIYETDANGDAIRMISPPPTPSGGHIFTLAPNPKDVRSEARQNATDSRVNRTADRAELEWRATHNPDGTAKIDAQESSLDDASLTFYAQQVLAGAPMPALGSGKSATALRQAIMGRVGKLAGATGLSGADLARQIAHYKAGSGQVANLEKQLGTIRGNEATALANGQQFLDRSQELPLQTGFTPLNSLTQGYNRITSNPTQAATDAAYNTFVNEYAKVVSGSPSGAGTMSDSARHEAMDTIRGNAGIEAKRAAFTQMKVDMENRIHAAQESINTSYQGLTEKPGYEVPGSLSEVGAAPAKNDANNILAAADGTKHDPAKSAALLKLIRNGVTYDDATAALGGIKTKEGEAEYNAAVTYAKAHRGAASADVQVPTSLLNDAFATGPGTFIANAANAAMGGIPVALGGENARLGMEANNAANTRPAFAGKLAGFVGGSTLLGKGLAALKGAAPVVDGALEAAPGALAKAMKVLRPTAADAILGTTNGASENPDHPIMGAAEGLASVVGGNVIGHGLGAGARGIAGTQAGANLINAARGAVGRAPMGAAPQALDAGQRIVANSGALDPKSLPNVTGQLQDAARLKMPMMAADTDPRLTALLGSAGRHSPDVGADLAQTLDSRMVGRNGRAVDLVGQHLAPTGNIADIVAQNKAAAGAAGKPHYDAAMNQPPVPAEQLGGLLDTPGGSAAAQQGYTNALNSGKTPGELSMGIDPTTGLPRFDTQINWPTLQNIKLGLDSNINKLRNPITNKLDLTDPNNQSLNSLRASYIAHLGQLNPDYAAGNAAYASVRGQGNAAQQGFDLAGKMGKMNPDEVGKIASNVSPQYQPHFQQGVASRFADNAVNQRVGNPHDAISGPDGAQQRLRAIFPDGADNMIQAGQMEKQFDRTKNALTGNSQTQSRGVADQIFQRAAMPVGLGMDAVTALQGGMPGVGTLAAMGLMRGAKHLADRAEGKMTSAAADQVAPLLSNTDPIQSLSAINALLKQQAARQAYISRYGQVGGAAGGVAGGGLFLSSQGQ